MTSIPLLTFEMAVVYSPPNLYTLSSYNLAISPWEDTMRLLPALFKPLRNRTSGSQSPNQHLDPAKLPQLQLVAQEDRIPQLPGDLLPFANRLYEEMSHAHHILPAVEIRRGIDIVSKQELPPMHDVRELRRACASFCEMLKREGRVLEIQPGLQEV